MLKPLPAELYPHFDLLQTVVGSRARPPWKSLEAVFLRFGGASGRVSWLSTRESVIFGEARSKVVRSLVLTYGVAGIANARQRARVVKMFDGKFAALLADYAIFRRPSRSADLDRTDSLDRLIDALASDGLLTAPRISWIRRTCSAYGIRSRISSRQRIRLLDVLIEIRCGVTNSRNCSGILLVALLHTADVPADVVPSVGSFQAAVKWITYVRAVSAFG